MNIIKNGIPKILAACLQRFKSYDYLEIQLGHVTSPHIFIYIFWIENFPYFVGDLTCILQLYR